MRSCFAFTAIVASLAAPLSAQDAASAPSGQHAVEEIVVTANDGIEPGVGFYVDHVYHGQPATAAFDFTDIERVEVLRGPQGTLFGKNTTAGGLDAGQWRALFDSLTEGGDKP